MVALNFIFGNKIHNDIIMLEEEKKRLQDKIEGYKHGIKTYEKKIKEIDDKLMKINRIVVLVLLLFMMVLIVTGYGLTKPNLINSLTGA